MGIEEEVEAVKILMDAMIPIIEQISENVENLFKTISPIVELVMKNEERWNTFDEATKSKMSKM